MRVPSRGSTVSLGSWPRDNRMLWPNSPLHHATRQARGSDYTGRRGEDTFGDKGYVGQIGERIGVARGRVWVRWGAS